LDAPTIIVTGASEEQVLQKLKPVEAFIIGRVAVSNGELGPSSFSISIKPLSGLSDQ